ncbi:hypothetical protein Cadr_000023050 [Camelus dromedarius]|uniref:Uncharacterized protein n=1 Tax=Camelus dromedarius TaxID=9838 RepID=A0A5N4CI68_CAMDR|nr:hypothetical protein Cadr_000023050 [Camelus dromedarius]
MSVKQRSSVSGVSHQASFPDPGKWHFSECDRGHHCQGWKLTESAKVVPGREGPGSIPALAGVCPRALTRACGGVRTVSAVGSTPAHLTCWQGFNKTSFLFAVEKQACPWEGEGGTTSIYNRSALGPLVTAGDQDRGGIAFWPTQTLARASEPPLRSVFRRDGSDDARSMASTEGRRWGAEQPPRGRSHIGQVLWTPTWASPGIGLAALGTPSKSPWLPRGGGVRAVGPAHDPAWTPSCPEEDGFQQEQRATGAWREETASSREHLGPRFQYLGLSAVARAGVWLHAGPAAALFSQSRPVPGSHTRTLISRATS